MCWFKKPIVEPETIEPTSVSEITVAEKEALLSAKFPGVPVFSTYKHLLASYNDIALFLAQDQTNKIQFEFPDFVCSDFSFRLMGQFSIPKWSEVTFGIVWTFSHALCCIITEDKKFYYVEPQTDEILEELGTGIFIRFIMI